MRGGPIGAAALTVIVLTYTATSIEAQPSADAGEIIEHVRERHEAERPESFAFVQRTIQYPEPGRADTTYWHEAIGPGRLRIDLDLDAGHGILFRDGVSHSFRSGQRVSSEPGLNPFLVILDVYHQPVDRSLHVLDSLGYDLSIVREDVWRGEPVWVVGAEAGDQTSRQFWVSRERLVPVRIVDALPNGASMDGWITKYARLGGALMETEILIHVNGRLVQTEEYTNLRIDVDLPEAFFDPERWNQGREWWRAAADDSAAARVTALADEVLVGLLEAQPEIGTFHDLEGAIHDRLQDNSLKALIEWRVREDAWLERVRAIDPAALEGSREWVTYAYIRETLESSIGARVCSPELWPVSQITGWQVSLPNIYRAQPTGSEEARNDALARTRDLTRFIDVEIANLRDGVREGYLQSRIVVERVIEQLENLLAQEDEDWFLLEPAARDSTPGFRDALLQVIQEQTRPAVVRYRDFLRDEYLPRARQSLAVGSSPNGTACYQAFLRQFTTLDLDPDSVHARGLAELEALKAEQRRLAADRYGVEPSEVFQKMTEDPAQHFESRQAIVEYAQSIVDRVEAATPAWFERPPRSRVVVEAVPEWQESTTPGAMYVPGTADGSRPGIFRINTIAFESQIRMGKETLAFHEAIPGHHFQLAIALEAGDAHPLSRILFNSGFVEGWALYAERLADEMGLFTDDAQRIAMLGSQAFRAARMVVDTGIHLKGWTREQALEFMAERVGGTPEGWAVEVDRYIAWPGQAPSYHAGMMLIRDLRRRAERDLGDDFDVREFHGRVLEDGSLPLWALEQKIEGWIATEERP